MYHNRTHRYAVGGKGNLAVHGLEGKKGGFFSACKTSKLLWISSTECEMETDVLMLVPPVALSDLLTSKQNSRAHMYGQEERMVIKVTNSVCTARKGEKKVM